jgi:cation diffusion facilitator family transporter
VLIAMKVAVGIITGSVSIISEAIHSTMDLLAAIIAFVSVKLGDVPADKDHPYGHQKYENVSGVIEAILILVASGLIIKEAIKKIVSNDPIESIGIGFIVMFISAAVNYFVSKKLYKVAKEEDSVAIAADALHLKMDVLTSVGVAVGLMIIWITGLNFLDPVIAILIALFILKESVQMLMTAFNPLLDAKLSDAEIEIIKQQIEKYKDVYMDYHDIRTRKAGSMRHIDFHLAVPLNMTVADSHTLCDKIEDDIERTLKHANILIHIEPCAPEGQDNNDENIMAQLRKIAKSVTKKDVRLHHVHVHNYGKHIELTAHIKLPNNMTLEEAHNIATSIENKIRKKLSYEPTLHVEPLD